MTESRLSSILKAMTEMICNIFLPLMTDVFLLVYGACMIGELIVSIWTVILLYKSYKAMVDYTPRYKDLILFT